MANNKESTSAVNWAGFALLLVSLGGLAAAIWAFVYQANLPTHQDLGVLTVVVFTALGLVSAAFTFGILRGTGLIRGKIFGTTWEFGGPAAILVLFVILGVRHEVSPPSRFRVVVDFVLNDEPIADGGTLRVYIPEELSPPEYPIIHGRSTFEVPAEVRLKSCSFHTDIIGLVVKSPKKITLAPGDTQVVQMLPVAPIQTVTEVSNSTIKLTLSFTGAPNASAQAGIAEILAPSILRAPISQGKATFDGIPSTESGKNYPLQISGIAGYQIPPRTTVAIAEGETSVQLMPVPPAVSPETWKLIWVNHFEPGRLYEVVQPEISVASVSNDTFRQWCQPFNDSRYEILERVVVAKDEHWQISPDFLTQHHLPMLNERWFHIMDDEVWWAFRVRQRQ